MYHWKKLFQDFHKLQMTIGELEEAINNETWACNNDYSPAQRRHDDLNNVTIEYEARPF